MIFSHIALAAALQISLPAQPPATQDTLSHTRSAAVAPDQLPSAPITNAERSAIAITALDLDLHLNPATAGLESHSTFTLKNTGPNSLNRVPLQLSSALRWQSFAQVTSTGLKPIPFTQSPIATDTDHTGYAQEAILTPPASLAPGESLTLSTIYSGQIPQSSGRLELIGTPIRQATLTDWDQISLEDTALRGFGNVLWYPVAAPTALLGNGNNLFQIIGRNRLQQASCIFHLRLTVEYLGEAPSTVVLDGRTEPLQSTNDAQNSLVDDTHGLAVADFPVAPLGFRAPNLFLAQSPATVTDGKLLAIVSSHPEIIGLLTAAAAKAQPLLVQWIGLTPLTPLMILDHPGQSFEDDALLVTAIDPMAKPEQLAPQLVHGLTHAWLRSAHPWIDEGLAEFMNRLWTEHAEGREAVVAQLQQDSNLIALAEPDLATLPSTTGQPLTDASAEVYFRIKAAAVWWQLRDILGDETLQQALHAYRHSESLNTTFDSDPKALERTLEGIAKRDLAWFFDDWVYHDRGLPDLSIVGVSPRRLPVRPGRDPGFLVAVEVRNDGGAVAEVPVTVRSGTFTASERLRIAAHTSASTRIVFQGTPEQVQVNDGTTPEVAETIHIRQIKVQP